MQANGTVFLYGDNVDTDVIIPARYLNLTDASLLAAHCMEDIDPNFRNKCRPGDIVAAGFNFGCGSSREHAPLVLKTAGVSLVVAKTFARIFYRNAINIGLPIVECPQAVDEMQNGDQLSMDFASGIITNHSRNAQYQAAAFPPFIQRIIAAGGLVPAVQQGAFDD